MTEILGRKRFASAPAHRRATGDIIIDPLFEPLRINRLDLKNRIYMLAMHLGMAIDYEVTDPLVACDDAFIPGLTRLADTICADGACSAVQLNHTGRAV